MTTRDFRILEDLMRLEKPCRDNGHHLFFEYLAHVDKVTARIFLNGWKENSQPDYEFGVGSSAREIAEFFGYVREAAKYEIF